MIIQKLRRSKKKQIVYHIFENYLRLKKYTHLFLKLDDNSDVDGVTKLIISNDIILSISSLLTIIIQTQIDKTTNSSRL